MRCGIESVPRLRLRLVFNDAGETCLLPYFGNPTPSVKEYSSVS